MMLTQRILRNKWLKPNKRINKDQINLLRNTLLVSQINANNFLQMLHKNWPFQ